MSVGDDFHGAERAAERAIWPNEELEKQMLRDAANAIVYSEDTIQYACDTECHVKALLARVRELEQARSATNESQDENVV